MPDEREAPPVKQETEVGEYDEEGRRHGEWTFYSPNGAPALEARYDHGDLIVWRSLKHVKPSE